MSDSSSPDVSAGASDSASIADAGVDGDSSDTSSRRRLGLPLWAVTLMVAGFVIGVDQFTKYLAVANLEGQASVQLVGTWLQLTFVRNPGAAFSLGTGYTFIFSLLAFVVAGVIIWTARTITSLGWAIALGGLLGGAVGNLIDRIFREPGLLQGHVVDFLQLPNWPIFNVADMAVVGSAILMVLLALKGVPLRGVKS